MKRLALALCMLMWCGVAWAQAPGTVLQSGPVTPGHGVKWITNGVIGDSGGIPGGGIPFPTPATLGGLFSSLAVPHQWVDSILTSGLVHTSRPSCADLSDSAPSCSIDATNATNITSGLLDSARLERSGDASKIATVSGVIAVGHCAVADASGNLIDGGSSCGGGHVENCVLLQGGLGGCLQLQASRGSVLLQ